MRFKGKPGNGTKPRPSDGNSIPHEWTREKPIYDQNGNQIGTLKETNWPDR